MILLSLDQFAYWLLLNPLVLQQYQDQAEMISTSLMPNDCSTFFLVLHHLLLLCPSRHLYQMNYLLYCWACYLLVIEAKVDQLELKTIGLYYQALKEVGSFLCEFMLFVFLKVFVSALWFLAPTFFFEPRFPTKHPIAIDVN